MVVKEGYKNTEVGVIPEDWKVKKQMDIVKYINGRAYSIHEWETKGVPVVRLQNLTNKGGDFYCSQLKLPEYQYMYKGDLIYMWSASFGPYIWWGDKAIFHYHIWRIECDKVKIDKSFYYYKLIEITEELKKGTSGSNYASFNKRVYGELFSFSSSITRTASHRHRALRHRQFDTSLREKDSQKRVDQKRGNAAIVGA